MPIVKVRRPFSLQGDFLCLFEELEFLRSYLMKPAS